MIGKTVQINRSQYFESIGQRFGVTGVIISISRGIIHFRCKETGNIEVITWGGGLMKEIPEI